MILITCCKAHLTNQFIIISQKPHVFERNNVAMAHQVLWPYEKNKSSDGDDSDDESDENINNVCKYCLKTTHESHLLMNVCKCSVPIHFECLKEELLTNKHSLCDMCWSEYRQNLFKHNDVVCANAVKSNDFGIDHVTLSIMLVHFSSN